MIERHDNRVRHGIGALLIAVTVTLGPTGVSQAAGAAAPGGVSCQVVPDFPVSLSDGAPRTYHMWGELCATAAARRSAGTVQVLIPGATYTHEYWDLGYNNGYYSYARHVAASGIATFAIDRIGTGASSRQPPASAEVTLGADSTTVHQVVQGLRDGSATGVPFRRVIAVGHSLGAGIAWQEASTYHDVDGVIVTGATHDFNPAAFGLLAVNLYPANQDPLLASLGLDDDGFITTMPGIRGTVFYNAAYADPDVIAYDEAHKDTFSIAEFSSLQAGLDPAITLAIHVPVLLIDGDQDLFFCQPSTVPCSSGAQLQQREAPYYPPDAHLQAVLVPGAGHDVSLHINHWCQEAASILWTYGVLGQRPPPGCS